MTKQNDKVREWWINPSTYNTEDEWDIPVRMCTRNIWDVPVIHVIEMSAYLKLQEELAEVKKQLDEHLKVHDMTCPYPDCNRMFWADFRDESRKPKGLAFVVTPKNPTPKVRKELEKELEEARAVIETYAMTDEAFPEYGNVARDFLTKCPKKEG